MPFKTNPGDDLPDCQITATTPPDTGGRRSGKDRRSFSYTAYIPERRAGDDRRSGDDRRRRGRRPSDRHADEAAAAAPDAGPRAAPRS